MSDEYERAILAIQDEPPPEISLLCQAIHDNNENAVRVIASLLREELTIVPKRCAIDSDKPQFLRILLEEDPYMHVSLMEGACENKNREIIDTLLAYGWDINKPFVAGGPLWTSVNDMSFMQWLIDRGADIKTRSFFDSSTLSKAIVHGNMDVVHFLLAQEEDINRGDLLHCAAQRENQHEGAMLVEELVEMGAEIDAHRYLHEDAIRFRYFSLLGTPLHTSCHEMNFPIAKALLDHGANPRCKMLLQSEETGPTPLELAAQTGDPKWIELFMAKDLLNARL